MPATQLTMHTEIMLQPEGDKQVELLSIVERVQRGMIQHPPHQRDFIWSNEKRRGWIERIATRRHKPVGVIVTYQIDDGKPSPVYINDGWQRVSTTIDFLNDPQKYGYTPEQAQDIVMTYELPVQHRHYATQDDALQDFQHLNMGTALTPYEFCHGIFTYMQGYDQQWRRIIDELHEVVASNGQRVLEHYNRNSRQRHKLLRHDYALFCRFIEKTKMLTDFKHVGSDQVRSNDIKSKTIVEWRLRNALELIGPEAANRELHRFTRLIKEETALMADIWEQCRPSPGAGISATLYRWILDCAIWRRANELEYARWEMFVKLLLQHTQGSSILQAPGKRTRTTLGLGHISLLKTVCAIIGSDIYSGKAPRARTRAHLKSGYDQSHLLPFAEYGEGPTTSEPAGRNRSRGAAPINQHD
jgi:hypothetical protein